MSATTFQVIFFLKKSFFPAQNFDFLWENTETENLFFKKRVATKLLDLHKPIMR